MKNVAVYEAWAEDLEKTKASQGNGCLKTVNNDDGPSGYCCLGRLGLVLKKKFPDLLKEAGYKVVEPKDELTSRCDGLEFRPIGSPEVFPVVETIELPKPVMKAIGMTAKEMSRYIRFNDTLGYTFKDIAKEIRKSLKASATARARRSSR